MSSSNIIHGIQYLRAIAAIAVVYSHAAKQHEEFRQWLPHYGDIGVDIFFIISGFILVLIAKDNDSVISFFTRRIRRIVPLYWFFTFLMAGLFLIIPSVFQKTNLEVGPFLMSLFFLPHWSPSYEGEVWPLVVPGWSLNYEMYFYLVFSMALCLPKAVRVVATSLVIVSVFSIAKAWPTGSALQHFFQESIVLEFVFGMILAVLYRRIPTAISGFGFTLVILGLGWLVVEPLLFGDSLSRAIKFGIPAMAIVVSHIKR